MSEAAAELTSALRTEVLGRPLRHFPVAVTTEALALAWARQEDAPEGATVVADRELSGRQRKGPPWIPLGSEGLYASVVLRPALPPEGEGLLWLLGSLGASQGLTSLGAEPAMEWPDDIYLAGRKVASVKVEAKLGPGSIESAIVSFMVNVDAGERPGELAEKAISLEEVLGREIGRAEVLAAILEGLEAAYGKGVAWLLERYRQGCSTIGRDVTARLLPRGEVSGRAETVDDFGSLVLAQGTRMVPIDVNTLRALA